jgi:hypothetical protein
MPKGWNKTVADLFEEMRQGKRLTATDEEGDWAREYERSLLPARTVFPRDGQIWESVSDCEVDFEVFFAAPGGAPAGTFRLSQGEGVRIGAQTNDEALLVHFLPVRYEDLQTVIVAPHVRANPRYSNYALYAKTGYFSEHFRLVKDVAS